MLSSISISNMVCWSTCGYHLCIDKHMEDDSKGSFENLQEAAVANKITVQECVQ